MKLVTCIAVALALPDGANGLVFAPLRAVRMHASRHPLRNAEPVAVLPVAAEAAAAFDVRCTPLK